MNRKINKYIIFFILIIVTNTFSATWANNNNNVYRLGIWEKSNTAIIKKDNLVSGFEPDLFKLLSPYLSKGVDFVIYKNYEECLKGLENNEIDVIMSSIYSNKTAEDFEYIDIMVRHVDTILVSYNDNYAYQEYDLLNNKIIGYRERDNHSDLIMNYLNSRIKNTTFIAFPTENDVKEALVDGKIDLAAIGLDSIESTYTIIDRFNSYPTYYLTRKGETSEINTALSKFLSSSYTEYSSLYYKYYPGAITTELTRDELNYINSNPEIIASTVKNKNVFATVSDNGEIIGIFPDIISAINKVSGLNIILQIAPSSKTLQEVVEENECDIAIGLDSLKSIENNDNYIYCNSILDIPMELIVKSSTVLDKGKKQKIVITREECISDSYIKENYPNWEIVYETNLEKRYDMLISGEVDCLTDSSYSFNYLSSKEKYRSLIRYPVSLFSSELNILVQKDKVLLSQIINKSLVKVKKENLSNIIENNISKVKYSPTLFDIFLSYRMEYLGIFLLTLIFFFIIYFMASSRRRKELEKSNSDLMRAEQVAIEANKAKSIFLARMSHDMRTPLGAVIALAEFGRNEVEDEIIKSYFIDINDSATYLLSLMDDLLDSQKLQNDNFEFNYNTINFCNIIKRILTVVENKAKEKNIKINIINECSDINSSIFADEKRLSQIYVNILNNAIKYTPSGGVITWTNKYKLLDDDKIRITSMIQDTGVGMSSDFVKNYLFKPFSKELNTLSEKEGGSGLGLSICKKLVNQMNGVIQCDSTLGVGSTFKIILDFKIIKNSEINKNDNSYLEKDDLIFFNKRMLVCDDTEINIKIAKKILENKFIEVDVAYNGEEAINKALANKYDAILMDIRMPVLDGLEATKRIRKFNKTIPIIAFSANAYSQDISKSIDAVMNEHLAKPIDTKRLFNILKKLFSEKE